MDLGIWVFGFSILVPHYMPTDIVNELILDNNFITNANTKLVFIISKSFYTQHTHKETLSEWHIRADKWFVETFKN